MRMILRLHEGTAKLKTALKNTRLAWDATEATWKDDVRRAFAEKHLEPMEADIEATLRAVQRLREVLARAEKDCQ